MSREDLPGKGWFELPGEQIGDRSLLEQMTGLGPILSRAAGASVLDLGCAEGLISLELMKAGAAVVHGIESVATRVATANRLFQSRNAAFFVADLAGFITAPPAGLMPSYEIVLALSIAHKFRDPDLFLTAAAGRATRTIAIRLPSSVLTDRRSGFRPIDIPELMRGLGFVLAHTAPGPRDEWVGIFDRA